MIPLDLHSQPIKTQLAVDMTDSDCILQPHNCMRPHSKVVYVGGMGAMGIGAISTEIRRRPRIFRGYSFMQMASAIVSGAPTVTVLNMQTTSREKSRFQIFYTAFFVPA